MKNEKNEEPIELTLIKPMKGGRSDGYYQMETFQGYSERPG